MSVLLSVTRTEIMGPSYRKISELGVVQHEHGYDLNLLNRILVQAKELKDKLAQNRHLNLHYIRGVHRYIPEVEALINDPIRQAKLNELAGTPLEPYPLPESRAILTFMSPEDGTIDWHSDGVSVVELIPLEMKELEGGKTEVFKGTEDMGRYILDKEGAIPDSRILSVKHQTNCAILSQFFRVLHRSAPITAGSRITLIFGLRSVEKPFIDDNMPWYLGADNPNFDEWMPAYLDDMQSKQLPAYLKFQNKSRS